jgi:hypothetical protein
MVLDVPSPSRTPQSPVVPSTTPGTTAGSLPPPDDGLPTFAFGPEAWLVLWFAVAAALALVGGHVHGRPARTRHRLHRPHRRAHSH